MDALLLTHAAATWALFGLIWVVQLVQYPGFLLLSGKELGTYHDHHCARITWVVAPLMAAELLTGLALLLEPPAGVTSLSLGFGLGLIAVNWLATGLVSIPLHNRVPRASTDARRRLVTTNWIRTVAWSLRGGIALAIA